MSDDQHLSHFAYYCYVVKRIELVKLMTTLKCLNVNVNLPQIWFLASHESLRYL